MKYTLYIVILISLLACDQQHMQVEDTKETTDSISITHLPFIESDSLILSSELSYKILFAEGDTVYNAEGEAVPAKGLQDLVIYLPKNGSSTVGELFVGHESASLNDKLGHGGGATIMSIENTKGWKVKGDKYNVDFSSVGYTMLNCGGKLTPYGTILMAEETIPATNEELVGKIIKQGEPLADTLKDNFGWMVEVDPVSKKALRKLTAMGRFSHEDAICLPDHKTVILTNDESPAVLFKFVATQENDFSQGKLFAYTENGDHWIALPNDYASLKNIKEVAIKLGATLFVRHEWVTQIGDNIYIAETGEDFMQWDDVIAIGGEPASHFEKFKISEGNYSDYYGRILKLNTNTWELSVQIEGGKFGAQSCFSNPDCITNFNLGGKNYLIISEDIKGITEGRVSDKAVAKGDIYCEVYLLDLSIKNPKPYDLIRIAAAPRGSETTGLCFTPDEKTLFMAIQHPDTTNINRFNCTNVIAITGFNR